MDEIPGGRDLHAATLGIDLASQPKKGWIHLPAPDPLQGLV